MPIAYRTPIVTSQAVLYDPTMAVAWIIAACIQANWVVEATYPTNPGKGALLSTTTDQGLRMKLAVRDWSMMNGGFIPPPGLAPSVNAPASISLQPMSYDEERVGPHFVLGCYGQLQQVNICPGQLFTNTFHAAYEFNAPGSGNAIQLGIPAVSVPSTPGCPDSANYATEAWWAAGDIAWVEGSGWGNDGGNVSFRDSYIVDPAGNYACCWNGAMVWHVGGNRYWSGYGNLPGIDTYGSPRLLPWAFVLLAGGRAPAMLSPTPGHYPPILYDAAIQWGDVWTTVSTRGGNTGSGTAPHLSGQLVNAYWSTIPNALQPCSTYAPLTYNPSLAVTPLDRSDPLLGDNVFGPTPMPCGKVYMNPGAFGTLYLIGGTSTGGLYNFVY